MSIFDKSQLVKTIRILQKKDCPKSDSELSGKTCIADCHFWPADCHQSFQGIVSSSWQEWQEIPYVPPYEPPSP